MGSPWDFAIAQTMQRHGGSNRLLPKAAHPTLRRSSLCRNAPPTERMPTRPVRAGMSPRSRRTAARRARDAFRQIAMRLPLDGKSGAIPSDALIA